MMPKTKKLVLKNLKSSPKKFPPAFSVKSFFRAYINAIKTKTLFFDYPFSMSTTMSQVLVCLEKNSRIAGYKIFPQNKNVKIFLSYDLTQNKPLVPQIMYYSSQGRTRSATFKNLQQFHMKHPNFFTLIGTETGIMDIKKCLFHKCGGEFLLSLT